MAALACSVSGCSLDETTPVPGCDGGGSVVIVAQSVPGAAFVPCIDDPGSGWEATRVHVDEDGTRMRFQLGGEERASADLSFTASCGDVVGRAIRSEVDGVDAWSVDAAGRRYSFRGGCVLLLGDNVVGGAAIDALIESVVLVERDRLAADVGLTSLDREL